MAGVPRQAQNRARHGACVPLRQLTVRHALAAACEARSQTFIGMTPGARRSGDAGRLSPGRSFSAWRAQEHGEIGA